MVGYGYLQGGIFEGDVFQVICFSVYFVFAVCSILCFSYLLSPCLPSVFHMFSLWLGSKCGGYRRNGSVAGKRGNCFLQSCPFCPLQSMRNKSLSILLITFLASPCRGSYANPCNERIPEEAFRQTRRRRCRW